MDKQEHFSKVLASRVDVKQRKIYLHGGMEHGEATFALVALDQLSADSSQPITISLYTWGGDAEAGFAIYDAIRACPTPVDVVGVGEVYSAGVIALQAARKRLLMPHTHILVHPIKLVMPPQEHGVQSIRAQAGDLGACMRQLREMLILRGVTPRAAARICRRESYFTAAQAVDAGIADAVLEAHGNTQEADQPGGGASAPRRDTHRRRGLPAGQ